MSYHLFKLAQFLQRNSDNSKDVLMRWRVSNKLSKTKSKLKQLNDFIFNRFYNESHEVLYGFLNK